MARNVWSLNTFQSINNWDIPEKALETLMDKSAQVFIIKFVHGHLSTRRHMHRIKKAKTDKCPACEHIVKTEWRFLSCPKRSLTWREELLPTLGDTSGQQQSHVARPTRSRANPRNLRCSL
jgi:hypothetical protein